jgi:2-polyprenyl-6-methoxyphenol hydroxylase-like FAD-dependent oxidoreductase
MSLTASEQRALARIERALRSRDPLLESLFATFTSLTWREAMPARERVQRRGWRPRMITLVPLAFVLIAAIIAVGSLGAASRSCAPGQAAASAASRCAARPSHVP